MNASELKEKYWSLYEYMAASKKPENMKAFGRVMTDMMHDLISSSPSKAEEYIERLECVRWKNYLTQKEAERIVSEMEPVAPWTRDVWKRTMESMGLPLEEEPYYNRCALWTEMNKVYSDSANSIAMIMGVPLTNIGTEKMVKATHALAVDNLKDEDGKYNIRSYFLS